MFSSVIIYADNDDDDDHGRTGRWKRNRKTLVFNHRNLIMGPHEKKFEPFPPSSLFIVFALKAKNHDTIWVARH